MFYEVRAWTTTGNTSSFENVPWPVRTRPSECIWPAWLWLPESAIPKLLEIQADETDHVAIISDLLLEAVAGESADQEELVPGVE